MISTRVQDYLSLQNEQKEEVLLEAFNQLENHDPVHLAKCKEIYTFICRAYDLGEHDYSIPGLLISAMVDMPYQHEDSERQKYMKKNFKTEYLKKHGVENRDWIFVGKNSMSSTWCCHHYSENIYYFKVPAWPEKEDLKLDCNHNSTKHAFITPNFAFSLIKKYTTNPYSRAMDAFVDKVHILSRSFMKRVRSGGVFQLNEGLAIERLNSTAIAVGSNTRACEELKWDLPELREPSEEEIKRHEVAVEHAKRLGKKPPKLMIYPKRKSNDNIYGALYPKVCGEINFTLIGMYAYEWRKVNNLPKSTSLVSYMDKSMLAQRSFYFNSFQQMCLHNSTWTHQDLFKGFVEYMENERINREKHPFLKEGSLRDPGEDNTEVHCCKAEDFLREYSKMNKRKRITT
jgi:hypothetical protein